jgi:deoxycytidylate deaminase
LNDWPGCVAFLVKAAEVIEQWAGPILGLAPKVSAGPDTRRRELQNAGTLLRKKEPELVAKLISTHVTWHGLELEGAPPKKPPTTVVYIVDSLKNLNDVSELRRIFRDEFLLAFVSADRETRWHRLKEYRSWVEGKRAEFDDLDAIDRDEKSRKSSVGGAGQETAKLAQLADYFIVNNRNRQELQAGARRIINLLLGGVENSQPTADERRMHLAFSASNSSGCLSRQVGAAIFNPAGDIIGLGHNDVPKTGGGLYSVEDEKRDHRCYLIGDSRCANETLKRQRFDRMEADIFRAIQPNQQTGVHNAIKKSEFQNATEYCRAVHGEMGALLSALRSGAASTIGSTMYVTTYPCHNCAKHILGAGIKRVVYVEPYPKSLAADLHSDGLAIDPPEDEHSEKTVLVPYQGVAPRRFHDFFAWEGSRKDDTGRAIRKSREQRAATPRFALRVYRRTRSLDNFRDVITTAEWQVADEVRRIIRRDTRKKKRARRAGDTGRKERK